MQVPDVRGRQFHVGILYRSEGDGVVLLDLAWHHVLRRKQPDGEMFWITCHIDDRVQESFAVWLEELWQMNQEGGIPYSIVSAGTYWDEARRFVRTAAGDGLTCATFITTTFETFGLPIVQVSSWPRRPSRRDRRWQRNILRMLSAYAPVEHVEAQRKCIGKVTRFRPDQVAGAFGVFMDQPISYLKSNEAARLVAERISLPRIVPTPYRKKSVG